MGMLSGSSLLSARVSVQAAKFGNDLIVQTAGGCFYTKKADFLDGSDSTCHPVLCLLWQQRPLRVCVCVSLCTHVCVGGADWKSFPCIFTPFFTQKASDSSLWYFSAFLTYQSHSSPTKMLHILRRTSLVQLVEDRRFMAAHSKQTNTHTLSCEIWQSCEAVTVWVVCMSLE